MKEFSWVYELSTNIEAHLTASAHAYEYAINIVGCLGEYEKERLHFLRKRLGNVRNELGAYWMNQCAQILKDVDEDMTTVRFKTFNNSLFCFYLT